MTSVNTNAAAITALRTLQQTNASLDSTQARISTGLKIGEAKDNAAYWAISTTLKSDNKSLSTVKDALGLGSATVDVGYQGLTKAKDVLDEIKAKLTAASGTGVDRDTIQNEIKQLQDQLKSIATSSIFSGENWLSVDSSAASYDPNKQVVASFSRDANGSVSIGTIEVDTTQVALYDSSTADGAGGIVNGATSLKDSSGRDLAYGGKALTGNTDAGGIEAISNVAGTDAVKAKSVFTGTFTASNIDENDSITLNYQVDGRASAGNVTINAASVTGSGFATAGRISSVDELALATNNALRTANRTDVVAINDGGKLALQRTEAGAARSVQVTAWTGVDADFTGAGGVTDSFAAGASGLTKGSLDGIVLSRTPANSQTGAVYEVQQLGAVALGGDTPNSGDSVSVTIGGINGRAAVTITVGSGGAAAGGLDYDLTGKTGVQISNKIAEAISADARVRDWVSASVDASTGVIKLTYKEAGNASGATFNADADGRVAASGSDTFTMAIADLHSGAGTVKASANGTLTNGLTVLRDSDDAVTLTFLDSAVGTNTQVKITNADLVSANNMTRTLDTNQDWVDATNAALRRMGLDTKYTLTNPASNQFKLEARTAVHGQTIEFVETSSNALTASDADTAVQKQMGLAYTSGSVNGTDATTAKSTSGSKLPVGGITLDADDKIYMNVAVDGSKLSKLVTIDQATVNSALQTATQGETRMGIYSAAGLSSSDTITVNIQWNGSGTNTYALTGLTERSTAEEFAAKLNLATGFSDKGVASVENGRIVMRTNNVGSAASVEVTSVTNSNANAASGGLIATTADKSTKGTGANANADAQGKITTASDMARVVQAAMTKAGVTGVMVGTKNDALTFESTTAGAKGQVSVTDVQGVSGANQISVDTIDISSKGLKDLSADQVRQVLTAYIDVVNTAIQKVTDAASSLGSVASRIDMQKSFVNTLMDTIDKGVGNLVDADMSEESTKLQALQVKQQLGVQALSIANQSSQNILSLFRS